MDTREALFECVSPTVAPHIISGVIRHTLRPLPCLAEAFEVFGLHSMKSDINSVREHFKCRDVTHIQVQAQNMNKCGSHTNAFVWHDLMPSRNPDPRPKLDPSDCKLMVSTSDWINVSKHTFFKVETQTEWKSAINCFVTLPPQLKVDQSQAPIILPSHRHHKNRKTYTQTHKHCRKHQAFSTFVTLAGSTYLWASCSIVSGHDRNNSLLSFCQHGAEKH